MKLEQIIKALQRVTDKSLPLTFKVLGELDEWDAKLSITHPGITNSYRGYYDRVSIHWDGEPTTVGEYIKVLQATIGPTYHGWKGGDYTYDEDSLVHIGSCSETTELRPVGVEESDIVVHLVIAPVHDW